MTNTSTLYHIKSSGYITRTRAAPVSPEGDAGGGAGGSRRSRKSVAAAASASASSSPDSLRARLSARAAARSAAPGLSGGDAGSECTFRICSSAASDRRTSSARKSPRRRRATSSLAGVFSAPPSESEPEVAEETSSRSSEGGVDAFVPRAVRAVRGARDTDEAEAVLPRAGNTPPGFDPDRDREAPTAEPAGRPGASLRGAADASASGLAASEPSG